MHFFRLIRLLLVLAGLCAALAVRAVEIDGTYENTGSLASSATPQADGTISFQGLLELNFDYALTRAEHSETERVTLTQTATHLRLECRNREGRLTWTGSWEKGVGYTVEEDHVALTFRARRFKDDGFVFTLRPVPGRDLLLVDVQRINATSFGPAAQPIGSFLFGRLAAN